MNEATSVSEKHIDSLIDEADIRFQKVGKKTTLCVAVLKSGFEIVASSGCVDPANYDENLGRAFCMGRLREKLWELEGYLLQRSMYELTLVSGDVPPKDG